MQISQYIYLIYSMLQKIVTNNVYESIIRFQYIIYINIILDIYIYIYIFIIRISGLF